MKSTASSTRLEPFGMVTMSPPANEATWPLSTPGSSAMPKSMSGFCSLTSVMLKLPVPIMPTLPEPNCRWKVSPVSARASSCTLPALYHVARPFQHLLDAVALQRLAVGGLRLDRAAGRPDQRAEGEDVAAGAGARQEVAVHVAAERGDLVGVFVDLGEARRRLLRVEAGLAEQVLVPEQRRDVGIERHAVEPALVGRDRHVAGAGGLRGSGQSSIMSVMSSSWPAASNCGP